MASKNKNLTKDERVKKEYRRLKKLFADIPLDEAKVCDGLFWQAARGRIALDDMWLDRCKKGDTEPFTQSVNTDPYDRARPIVQLYHTQDKNYQAIIKQLLDLLPDDSEGDEARKKGMGWVKPPRSKRQPGGSVEPPREEK